MSTMAKEDYYSLLGVERDATPEQLKKAYRKKAIELHPDKNQGDKIAEEKFKEISEAYEILSNSEKKAAYDRYGHAAFSQGGMGGRAGGGGGGFHDPFDVFREVFGSQGGGIFEEFFGGGNSGGSGSYAQRGSDLRYDLEISLEEAATGAEKEVQYRRAAACSTCDGSGAEPGSPKATCSYCNGVGQVVSSKGFFSVRQACPQCQGAGEVIEKPCVACHGKARVLETTKLKVKIPSGVDTGSKLRSSGGGEAGANGGPAGDLYVVVHVKEHELFERHGEDLFCEIPIKFTLASLGGTIEIPTLLGKASLKIPSGTQSGTVFRLKGRGMPRLQSSHKGDQLVRVDIEVPKKLNAEQRKHLEAFAVACGDGDNPMCDSFFQKAKRFFERSEKS